MGQFRHHRSGKTRTMAFVLVAYVVSRSTLHVPTLRATFFAHAKVFNIVNTPIILLFSKSGSQVLLAEDNKRAPVKNIGSFDRGTLTLLSLGVST